MKKNTPHRQAGLTLLEVIISLTILSAASLGMVTMASRYADDMVTSVTATQMRSFGDASKAYIKDNYSAVMAVSTPTAPALINVATLIAAGKLPLGFSAANAAGQTMCTLVVQPTANRLQAMVVSEGGAPMADLGLGSLAATIGGSGGGVYSQFNTTIRGAVGGWAVPTATFDNLANNLGTNCAGAAGPVRVVTGTPVMALWFENGDTNAAFVSRDAVPGRPELNAMNTPLVMNSVQSLNAACTVTGAIAQDGVGGILSCQGGTWKPIGDGKCVGTVSDLNLLQTDGRCYNGSNLPNSPAGPEWVFVEVFRHINPANYNVAQRVVGMTGAAIGRVWQRNQISGTQAGGWSAWSQQADPTVGISANQIIGSGSQGSYGATTMTGQKNGWTGLEFRDAVGNYQINQMTNRGAVGYYDIATGRWLNQSDTQGNLLLDQTADMSSGRINPGWAVETWGCTTGQIGKAAYTIADGWAYNGKTLSCVNGVWKTSGGGSVLTSTGWATGTDSLAIYSPPGANTATHKVLVQVVEFNQCNFEQAHQSNGAFELPYEGYVWSGSQFCPWWSSVSYIAIATPR